MATRGDAAERVGLEGASAEAVWRQGEGVEEQFDYEAAQLLYREAVRRAGATEGRHWLTQYAAFLVERYGQFPEVAAWLDDAEFDPTDGADSKGGLTLPRLVLTAAIEVGHPRADPLDAQLAREFGEPESVGRLADALLAGGQELQAQALLEQHEPRLPAISRGAELLRQLRVGRDAACEAALAGVDQALSARDPTSARAALEAQRATWSEDARYKATEVRVATAERRQQAEALRAQIELHLDADDLAGALVAAEALSALNPDSDSDSATLSALQRQLAAQNLSHDLAAALALTPADRLAALVAVYGRYGADVVVPASLRSAWALVSAAHDALPADLVARGAGQLMTISLLRDALAADDLTAVARFLADLRGAWRQVETAQRAVAMLDAAARHQAQAEDDACAKTVRAQLEAGQLDEARQTLDSRVSQLAGGDQGGRAVIKSLRKELDEGVRRRQQRERLAKDVGRNLKAGRLFAARRALATLEGIDELGEQLAERWRSTLDDRCLKELCATPVPPFGLKLAEAPIASAVVDQRLLVVQDRLWLSVNLETRGLAPFQLPESFPLDATPSPRLGSREGRARLIGLSAGRLITIEQDVGAAPEVTNARTLSELTRGDGRVLSWALEPDADVLSLLFAKNGDGGNPILIRVDADTLNAISHDRVKPALASIVGVQGAPESMLAVSTPEARRRGGWAVARLGAARGPEQTWSQEDVAEPVAGFSAAVAWPEEDRIFAAYDAFDMFDTNQVQKTPSLLVLRGPRIVFASSDLRKRFAPMARIFIDHAWTLDPAAGRLWFAALPREDHDSNDAMLLGVNARSLRPDPPVPLAGVARVLTISATDDGAAALCRTHEGRHAVARASVDERGRISLTIDPLPV